jgi:hypothetical protein
MNQPERLGVVIVKDLAVFHFFAESAALTCDVRLP